MPEPMSIDEFVDVTGCPAAEVDSYRAEGLLDPDGDGRYDEQDLVRLNFIQLWVTGAIGVPGRVVGEAQPLSGFRDAARDFGNDLMRSLFGVSATKYTLDEAAEEIGLPVDQVVALGMASGVATPEATLSKRSVEILKLNKQMIDAGFPFEALLEGARVYADTLRRLSEASLQITHRYLCEPLQRAGHDDREIAMQVGSATEVIGPIAGLLVLELYQEYMQEAVMSHSLMHLEPRDPNAPPGSTRSTIVFIDLALFTTYAELEGDEAAVEVVDRFDRTVREMTIRFDGRIVKQIGDEFMLVFRQPVGAVRFAIAVQDAISRTERFVMPRTGIHQGSVLYRLGDYYGSAVNIASRIASMALPNSILITEPVAKAAADEGIEVVELGVRSLRGLEDPVPLYRVVTDAT